MPKQESTSQVPSRRICKQDFDKAPLQNAIPNQGLNAMSLCGTHDSLVTPSASCVYAEESTLVVWVGELWENLIERLLTEATNKAKYYQNWKIERILGS